MPEIMVRDNAQRKEVWMSRLRAEKGLYEPYRTHHRELQDWIQPRTGISLRDLNAQPSQRGSKKNTSDANGTGIINSSPAMALRACRSGLMAGISNPMSPWFRMSSWDEDLLTWKPAREWLYMAERYNYVVLERSNGYTVMGDAYRDTAQYGVAGFGSFADDETIFYYQQFPVGTFYFMQDRKRQINGFYHESVMRASEMVKEYGYRNCSKRVQEAYDKFNETHLWPVVWVVEENDKRIPGRYDKLNRPYRSVRFEPEGSDQLLLEETGYFELPIFVPRWDTSSDDKWPSLCPGMESLGDIRALQKLESDKLKQLDYRITPPMRAPSGLSFHPSALLPAHISYYDMPAGSNAKFEPIYQVTESIDDIRQEIAEHMRRIDRAFYADLWQMLVSMDMAGLDRQRTATEIAARQQEKILMLAPVLHSYANDMHRPMLLRQTNRGIRLGILPPPPEELLRAGLRIDFISILAQAHDLVRASSIERFNGYVGQVLAVSPRSVHVVNWDNQIRKYAEFTNQSPDTIRGEEEVAELKAAEAAQQQAMARVAMAQQGAEAAKTLGEANVDPSTALGQLLGQAGSQQPQAVVTGGV